MLHQKRLQQCVLQMLYGGEGPGFIVLDQARIADHVGDPNGG
jgi:hypothetical protein